MGDTSFNIDIFQGDPFYLDITVKDADNVPLNLSGFVITSCIKERYSSATGLQCFNTYIGTPTASGALSLALSGDQTKVLPPSQLLYDVQGAISGSVITFLKGYLNVFPQITY